MVVVHGCGDLRGIGAGDAADVLHEAVLEGDRRGQEQGVEGGAVEAFPDERAGADDQEWIRIGRVVGELVGDLAAFASLHAAAEDGDGLSGGSEAGR